MAIAKPLSEEECQALQNSIAEKLETIAGQLRSGKAIFRFFDLGCKTEPADTEDGWETRKITSHSIRLYYEIKPGQ